MLGQLGFAPDGQLRDKVQAAIDRLKCFEPEEGYYVAFSGGKTDNASTTCARWPG